MRGGKPDTAQSRQRGRAEASDSHPTPDTSDPECAGGGLSGTLALIESIPGGLHAKRIAACRAACRAAAALAPPMDITSVPKSPCNVMMGPHWSWYYVYCTRCSSGSKPSPISGSRYLELTRVLPGDYHNGGGPMLRHLADLLRRLPAGNTTFQAAPQLSSRLRAVPLLIPPHALAGRHAVLGAPDPVLPSSIPSPLGDEHGQMPSRTGTCKTRGQPRIRIAQGQSLISAHTSSLLPSHSNPPHTADIARWISPSMPLGSRPQGAERQRLSPLNHHPQPLRGHSALASCGPAALTQRFADWW